MKLFIAILSLFAVWICGAAILAAIPIVLIPTLMSLALYGNVTSLEIDWTYFSALFWLSITLILFGSLATGIAGK